MQKYVWDVLTNEIPKNPDALVGILLNNRGIKEKERDDFLIPSHPLKFVENNPELKKLLNNNIKNTIKLIRKAIDSKRPIVIHGDYDVDGVTATAILWRTIHNDLEYENVIPYIPNRFNEGYGLTFESLDGIKKLISEPPLLITVDCGIISKKEVNRAKEDGFTVIVTDHHQPEDGEDDVDQIDLAADETVWTDKATGAGIAWLISTQLLKDESKYLDLAALGTICDLQPLQEFNRSVAKYGLIELNKENNAGISALKEVSEITEEIDTYHCGWVLGPRLNASGRLETAMDSLRLLCTDSKVQALKIAKQLDDINTRRQERTLSGFKLADSEIDKENLPSIIFTASESYHEGIIGLVAGNLTREYNRPAIAVAIDKKAGGAKGSARSIKNISIIETLRRFDNLFESVGGHDMAAGFSIKVENIELLQKQLIEIQNEWPIETFNKNLKIDAEISADMISMETIIALNKLHPFGMDNFEPVLMVKNMEVFNLITLGRENKHIKLFLKSADESNLPPTEVTAILFNRPDLAEQITQGDKIDVAFNLSLNTWNGKTSIELKGKDIRLSNP